MTSFVAKLVTKRILGESIQNKFGEEDPYFEHVPATRLDGRPSKKLKRRKKALPPGISEQDGKVLTKVKRRAHRLDMCLFNFLGIRFGWSSVIALIPVAGDGLDAFMALMVLRSCDKIEGGLPSSLKFRMMLNIIIDFAIGLVPVLGDVADAAFHANTRNVVLLEDYLRQKGKKQLRKSGQPIPDFDPSSPIEFDRMMSESPPQYTSREPSREPSATRVPVRASEAPLPQIPANAKTAGGRGWFGRGKIRPDDLEMGQVHEPVRNPKQSTSNTGSGRERR